MENLELEAMINTTSSRILHIQCDSDADLTSERVINYLKVRKTDLQIPLYFNFKAHDIRFNSIEAMLGSFLTQILYNRPQIFNFDINDVSSSVERYQAWPIENKYSGWEHICADNGGFLFCLP